MGDNAEERSAALTEASRKVDCNSEREENRQENKTKKKKWRRKQVKGRFREQNAAGNQTSLFFLVSSSFLC